MSVNRTSLGKRISFYRSKSNLTQEVLAAKVNCSREYIVQIENGTKVPSLSVLVKIANTLSVSADELLLDCLEHSSSANSEFHRLLLDCNETEQTVIIRMPNSNEGTSRTISVAILRRVAAGSIRSISVLPAFGLYSFRPSPSGWSVAHTVKQHSIQQLGIPGHLLEQISLDQCLWHTVKTVSVCFQTFEIRVLHVNSSPPVGLDLHYWK